MKIVYNTCFKIIAQIKNVHEQPVDFNASEIHQIEAAG